MGIRTFPAVSHNKGEYDSIRAANSLFLVISLALHHHGMTFLLVHLFLSTVVVQLSVTLFEHLYPVV